MVKRRRNLPLQRWCPPRVPVITAESIDNLYNDKSILKFKVPELGIRLSFNLIETLLLKRFLTLMF
ncbi:MAG TPA: hypothetical protein VJ729_18000 [Nitrososphaeraceae archaeon]|nr:hypothetical protein [Nitrososphaeraceae archaeon]